LRLTYITVCSVETNPGILKKIKDWVEAATELGYDSDLKIIRPSGGVISYLKLNFIILKSKKELLLVRNPTHLRILLAFSILIARINGCIVIIDVPSPLKTLVKEIFLRKQNFFIKLLIIIEIIISGSIPFLFANKIIEYANEGWWYTLCCKDNVKLIGNGINLNRIKVRKCSPQWPTNKLILVGVANVAIWHGFDRMINAISIFNKKLDSPYKVYFNIIGDGPELNVLKKITNELNLEEFIYFHGMQLETNFIQSIYENSHLAVSSLGLFRIGLNTASVLKSREYVAIGIPFVCAGNDVDFLSSTNFRFTVDNSENIDDLVNLLETFSNISFPDPILIRKYAEENLSIKHKLKYLLSN
jgi:glycosyltransferase involved in cell wall biosynthesis